jgi:hypothetical protein
MEPNGTNKTTPKHLLIDAEYVERLRPCDTQDGSQGLIEGVPDNIGLGISFGCENQEWLMTKSVQSELTRDEVWMGILEHGLANWGDVDEATAEANFQALTHGGELKSTYHTVSGVRFEIVTNVERDCTSIHLAGEHPVWSRSEPELGPEF